MDKIDRAIKEAAEAVEEADALFITSGAGMGVDSGLPDFRGSQGFWKAYPALEEEGLSFNDLANPRWFKSDPARAWGFYGHRLKLYRETQPHAGFAVLRQWTEMKSLPSFVFTSNVDGHFQRAGFPKQSVFECHGSINHFQCINGCGGLIWSASELKFEVSQVNLVAIGDLPSCPRCGQTARPNILMFGDSGWLDQRSSEQESRFEEWKEEMSLENIVTIEIGAGTAIPTVRHTSEVMDGIHIRINVREAEGGEDVISLPLGGLEALQRINALLTGGGGTV